MVEVLTNFFTQPSFRLEESTPFTSIHYPIAGVVLYGLTLVFLPKLVAQWSKARTSSQSAKKRSDLKGSDSGSDTSTTAAEEEEVKVKENTSPEPVEGAATQNKMLIAFEVVHNCNLIILSVLMCVGGLVTIVSRAQNDGGLWNGFLCTQRQPISTLLDGGAGFWMYIYYLSKYYELLDTVILIVKGKTVIRLHMWHHASMLFVTWSWLNFPLIEGSVWCVFINSLIHVFMYYYYLLCTIGAGNVWWKRYLTKGQIVQFWSGMAVCACFLGAKAAWGSEACSGDARSSAFSVAVNASFILLFNMFYKKTYNKEERKPKTA